MIIPAIAGVEHAVLVDILLASGTTIRHWDICGRKLPFTSSIKNARDIVQHLVDEYGQRALQAESQQGVDWKALSHAVRVATQAIEFLRTAHITFPLPNAAHVLDIKLGRLPYQDVAREIEDLLERVEAEAERSSLPELPDFAWIDGFVCEVYGREIAAGDGLIARARAFATAAHAAVKQRRKYTDEPYINHPAGVARIVGSVAHTPEMVAAAWLRDVVEDTGVELETIAVEFGPCVADLVFWLTDQSKPSDGNRDVRKAIDREHLARAPAPAQTIKLADLIDNTASIERHDPEFAKVYCREKALLLDVLTAGDPGLMKIAREQIMAYEQGQLDQWLASQQWRAP